MNVSETTGAAEYIKAQRLGTKERKDLELKGLPCFPAALEEVFPGYSRAASVDLPVREIPADRVIGTVQSGRTSAFSASFLPLPEPGSEFAAKWITLCDAHLSDTGIRDPIECVEYLGRFYVAEGNKRASVLKYFGAVTIPACVKRVLPDKDDPAAAAYAEFLDFYRDTGVYDVVFEKTGEYAQLLSALSRKSGERWEERDAARFVSAFRAFRDAYSLQGGGPSPEEALLTFLKVYPYEKLVSMPPAELKKALASVWGDVKAAEDPEAITVSTVPNPEEKGVIGKLISGTPKHLDIAFISQRDPASSEWTRGHSDGAAYLEEALRGQVRVREYFNADSPEEAEALIDEAVENGAELVFTTTPPLFTSALRAAVKYPRVRFYNCSACQPVSSVRSYYCRTYEGKFITGLIAGALAENDLVGYIGSYPILGVPASINAFALGVRMTNPRARIMLEWSCMETDCVRKLRESGVRVISNRDIPVPDASLLSGGYYGTFVIDSEGGVLPVASPVWVWGRMYENIVRSILSGGEDKKDRAVNYWWGMDSGAIDAAVSELVPEGLRKLAGMLAERLKKGEFDVFSQKLFAQDGSLICDGVTPLSSMEILKMDRLADSVIGRIPEYEEIFPMSRGLVRELGVHRESVPRE